VFDGGDGNDILIGSGGNDVICGFRRKRPPIPIEGGQCSDRLRTAFR